jgi:hypothetical protein
MGIFLKILLAFRVGDADCGGLCAGFGGGRGRRAFPLPLRGDLGARSPPAAGVCGAGVVVLCLAGRHQWELALPSADRGLELSIAAVIVLIFLFVRYYDVRIERTDRSLAIGLCLYSCFRALNDTILERYLYGYTTLWSVLGLLAFFASLCLWSWALRKSRNETAAEETLLPAGVYETVGPQINLRLRSLNEQLGQMWKSEATRQ